MTEKTDNTNIWRDAVSARADCISLQELHGVLEGNFADENTARHVRGCPHCQANLAMMQHFESPKPDHQQTTAVAWIVARLGSNGLVLPTPAEKNRLWRFPYIAGCLAAAFTLVLGISLFLRYQADRFAPIVEPSGMQTMRSASLYLTAPSGNVSQAPDSFQWQALQGAKSYSIEVMEVDGSILWSGQSGTNFLAVSSDLAKRLQPNRVFTWKITALDSSGKVVATSNQERFVIKPVDEKKRR